jgi:hypothetical protein
MLLQRAAANDSPGVVWFEENTLPSAVVGAVCDFSLSQPISVMVALLIVQGMRFLLVHQLAVSAWRY